MSADPVDGDTPRARGVGAQGRAGRPSDARETRASRPRRSGPAARRAEAVGDLAGQIVGQAASILEEELAAGIGAAREIEDRFVDVERIRATDPDQLVHRLRQDAHDIVDIAVDLLDVAVTSTGAMGRRAVAVTVRAPEGNGNAAQEDTGPNVPALIVPDPVRTGEIATTALVVENNRSTPTDPLAFACSDLVTARGTRIPASAVSFAPSLVVVEPESSLRVTVTVTVPSDADVGLYSGLLQADGLEHIRAVLSLDVVAAPPPGPPVSPEPVERPPGDTSPA